MNYTTGYVKSSKKTARKLLRIELSEALKSYKTYSLLNILLFLSLILNIKSTEVVKAISVGLM